MMKILEETQSMEVRIRCLQTIHDLQDSIDVNTIKSGVFKSFDKLRTSRDLDPQVSMLMLKIYKKSSDQLGPDEIGNKILPGIIPMLVGPNMSKPQFTEIMSCIKQLLTQIELTKYQTLPDAPVNDQNAATITGGSADPFGGSEENKAGGDFESFDDNKKKASDPFGSSFNAPPSKPATADPFGNSFNPPPQKPVSSDPFANAAKLTPTQPAKIDPFAGAAKPAPMTAPSFPAKTAPAFPAPPKQEMPKPAADPFASIGGAPNINPQSLFTNLGGASA